VFSHEKYDRSLCTLHISSREADELQIIAFKNLKKEVDAMPQGQARTAFEKIMVAGMNAKEITILFPEKSERFAQRLVKKELPFHPFILARELGIPRPGGKNGRRKAFCIGWFVRNSAVVSGMKVLSLKGDLEGVWEDMARDAISQDVPDLRFPFKLQRFDELRRINQINLRPKSKFESDIKTRHAMVTNKLKALSPDDPSRPTYEAELERLETALELSGLIRKAHQDRRLLSNMEKNPKRAHISIDYFSMGLGKYGLEAAVDVHVIICYFASEPVIPDSFRNMKMNVNVEVKKQPFKMDEVAPLTLDVQKRRTKAEMTKAREDDPTLVLRKPQNFRVQNVMKSKGRSSELFVDPKIKESVRAKEDDRSWKVEIMILAPKKKSRDEDDDELNPEDDDELFDGQNSLACIRDMVHIIKTDLFKANGITEIEVDSDGCPRNYATLLCLFGFSLLTKYFTLVIRNFLFPTIAFLACDQLGGAALKRLDHYAAIGHHVKTVEDLARVLSEVSNVHVFLANKVIEAEVEDILPQVVKSSVPFVKKNFSFKMISPGKLEAKRSPLDNYAPYHIDAVGLDAAPTDREKAAEDWYHRSKTLSAKRMAVSSKEDRGKLKRKAVSTAVEEVEASEDDDDSLSSSESQYRPPKKTPKKR